MIIKNVPELDYNLKLFILKQILVKVNMVAQSYLKNSIKRELEQMEIFMQVLYKKIKKINLHMDKDLEKIYLVKMEKD